MTYSSSASPSKTYICNICGEEVARTDGPPGRETLGCENCISTVRLRGLVALLSREIFGTHIALTDFPALKGVRGFGMSDPPGLAQRLEKVFDYTNTFYHQPPTIDIVNPPETELGRYDFIISSEVMEHIPPPAVEGFRNLHRLLKPEGLLLLTVPYKIPDLHDGPRGEHFPNLHQYTLTNVGGKVVLVNRTKDGKLELFEDLVFHGGDGSTLEMRIFTEESLKQVIQDAGFDEVEIVSENVPEYGVDHAETWSLPVLARKGKFHPPVAAIARAYGELVHQFKHLEGEYKRHLEFHDTSYRKLEREMEQQVEWVKNTEKQIAERTEWAQSLEKEKNQAVADFRASMQRAEQLEAQIKELWERLEALQSRKWTQLGKVLGRV